MCACLHRSVSVCVLTPGARPPSLLTLWRALCLSGSFFASLSLSLFFSLFSLLFPPSIFLPPPPPLRCFVFPLRAPYSLLLLFRISLTMVQDFYCLGRRGARLTKVSRMNRGREDGWIDGWRDGWMDCTDVGISVVNVGSGVKLSFGKSHYSSSFSS